MFRDILSGSRAIFIGVVFFVLVVGGSLLYSWHVHRSSQEELEQTKQAVQQLGDRTFTRAAQDNDVPVEVEPLGEAESLPETDNSERIPEETAAFIDDAEIDVASDALDMLPEETSEPDAPYGVSPYGFGPYPEVPTGFPDHLQPIWAWSEEKRSGFAGSGKDFELMHRVLVKLWNQGDQGFVGVTRADDNGRVYPVYPEVVYVSWSEVTDIQGKVHRYPGFTLAGPNVPRLSARDFTNGNGYPAHITVLDRETEGIEPYQFLGLQRR